jgi:drug/metabolite transporter (DMT)-like permease
MTIFLIIILTLANVAGDFLIKKATLRPGFSGVYLVIAGGVVWLLSAFGWFFVLKRMELSNSNGIFAVLTIIFVLAGSYFYFHEKVSFGEIAGFVLAIISIYLLARFA